MAVKFAIYSQTLKKYFLVYQGKGLYWEDDDFGELVNARMYKSKKTAIDVAIALNERYCTVVVPVSFVVDMNDITSAKDEIAEVCKEYLPNVLLIDKMSAEERNKISIPIWDKYKKQKQYLKSYSIEYKNILKERNKQFAVSYYLRDFPNETVDEVITAETQEEACDKFRNKCKGSGVKVTELKSCIEVTAWEKLKEIS